MGVFGRLLNFMGLQKPRKMPPKSNNQKKKDAEAAGRAPKKTKQEENAGKTAAGKKKEMQAKRAADRERRLAKLSANKNLAKSIHVTTIGPLLRIHLRTRMGIFKKKLKLNRCL